jgi:hypothetical protein
MKTFFYLAPLLLEREVFRTHVVEETNTHFVCSNFENRAAEIMWTNIVE